MSARPAPERPGDVVPEPWEFAGWPPAGALGATLAVGPLVVRLDRLDTRAAEAAATLAGAATGPAGEADLTLEVSEADRPSYLERAPGDRLRLWSWDEGEAVAMATHHAALLLDAEARRGLLVLSRQDDAELARSLQNALRFAVAVHLARTGRGLLLHAAALEADGRAVVLVGPSGAGKTTALGLARPWPALADDVALVTAPAGATPWTLHETPLWAEPGRRRPDAAGRRLPIGLLVRLEQAADLAVDALGVASAAALVAAHAPFLSRPEGGEPAAGDLAAALAAAVPAARLRFRRDSDLREPLEEALAAARPGSVRSDAP